MPPDHFQFRHVSSAVKSRCNNTFNRI